MDIFTAFFIGLGLSLDCFAVSMTCAVAQPNPRFKQWLFVALPFSIVQPAFTLLGWFTGTSLRHFAQGVDHWIAFGLLLIIGSRMVWNSFAPKEAGEKVVSLGFYVLIGLSIATSIDAFAVGISLGFVQFSIVGTLAVIGAVTFFMVMVGGFVGKNFSKLFQSKAELSGGIILILIALKILFEHVSKGI